MAKAAETKAAEKAAETKPEAAKAPAPNPAAVPAPPPPAETVTAPGPPPEVAPAPEPPPAVEAPAEVPESFESEEDLSDLPEALEMAIIAFGLKRAHVLGHRLTEDGVVVITRGGRKLHWPGDEEKAAALTESDKDGIPRKDFPPANLFGKRG